MTAGRRSCFRKWSRVSSWEGIVMSGEAARDSLQVRLGCPVLRGPRLRALWPPRPTGSVLAVSASLCRGEIPSRSLLAMPPAGPVVEGRTSCAARRARLPRPAEVRRRTPVRALRQAGAARSSRCHPLGATTVSRSRPEPSHRLQTLANADSTPEEPLRPSPVGTRRDGQSDGGMCVRSGCGQFARDAPGLVVSARSRVPQVRLPKRKAWRGRS